MDLKSDAIERIRSFCDVICNAFNNTYNQCDSFKLTIQLQKTKSILLGIYDTSIHLTLIILIYKAAAWCSYEVQVYWRPGFKSLIIQRAVFACILVVTWRSTVQYHIR